MAYKEFPIYPTEADPPTFGVADQKFTCLARPPGGALASMFWAGQSTSATARAAGVTRFIQWCLPDADADRFTAAILDKNVLIPLALLEEIAEWLVEEYGSPRPTTPSSGSPTGSAGTATTSEDGALSSESTPQPVGSSA